MHIHHTNEKMNSKNSARERAKVTTEKSIYRLPLGRALELHRERRSVTTERGFG